MDSESIRYTKLHSRFGWANRRERGSDNARSQIQCAIEAKHTLLCPNNCSPIVQWVYELEPITAVVFFCPSIQFLFNLCYFPNPMQHRWAFWYSLCSPSAIFGPHWIYWASSFCMWWCYFLQSTHQPRLCPRAVRKLLDSKICRQIPSYIHSFHSIWSIPLWPCHDCGRDSIHSIHSELLAEGEQR